MSFAGLHSTLLDFTVWDNDGLYALVTVVSIVFAIALIVVVMRKSRENDALNHPKASSALARRSAAQASAATSDQQVIAPQTTSETTPTQASTPSPQQGH